jgi:hypothetical protein
MKQELAATQDKVLAANQKVTELQEKSDKVRAMVLEQSKLFLALQQKQRSLMD